jgi:hypothetical protein
VIPSEHRRERFVVAGLLLLCGLCCVWIAHATAAVDRANACRRAQLGLLAQQVARPELVPDGAIQALDGLVGRRVVRITTTAGPAIAFAAAGAEADS